jgi:hypothetical protein
MKAYVFQVKARNSQGMGKDLYELCISKGLIWKNKRILGFRIWTLCLKVLPKNWKKPK